MKKSDMINRILEISSLYERQMLEKMDDEEIVEIFEELTDFSDMYPNGRDYDAEDEEF